MAAHRAQTPVILTIAWLVCAMSACTPGAPAATSTTAATNTPASPSTSPADVSKAQALDAYRGMWLDMAVAGENSDWKSPSLGRHATGDALSSISQALYKNGQLGMVTHGRPSNTPTVVSADPPAAPTTVQIADCGDSTTWLKYKRGTDQLADDVPGGRRKITATVAVQNDGAWRVTGFAVRELGTC
jgi:hypothetical protein